MKSKTGWLSVFLIITIQCFGWGPTGHRVTGFIAEKHLTKKAQIRQWQRSSIHERGQESQSYCEQVFDVGNGLLGYRYNYTTCRSFAIDCSSLGSGWQVR